MTSSSAACHAESMKRSFQGVVAGLLVGGSLFSSAQDKGDWRAANSNARSITGDIEISDSKLFLNFIGFTIAQIRKLDSAETTTVFASEVSNGSGNLYRLTVPAARRFLHHNTLCGSEDVQWMVTSVSERTLHVAFFSGADTPVFTPEAMTNSTDLCGTFSFVR
jgi:hypothetical protein